MKDTEERRYARAQRAAAQRLKEEKFCKIDTDDEGLFYEIELDDDTTEQYPFRGNMDEDRTTADDMAYVDQLSEGLN